MKKIILRLFFAGIFCSILGAICVFSVIFYFSLSLPKISTLADYRPAIPSQILAQDGTVLAEVAKERRYPVPLEEVPERILNAFLSAEDSDFYEHGGVHYVGILRAFLANIKAGRVVQGGSTITQQVAKSLLLTSERSITRKIKDFLLARKIEQKFSKEEILYLYLNQVYLGGGYYGIKSAFKGYYGKTLEEISVAEAAMIAGLLVAPSKYSPYRNPEKAKMRQEYVLKRMLANGKITQDEYEEARQYKLRFKLKSGHEFLAGYFTDWVRQEVIKHIGEEEFKTGGYKVHTSLDYELQKIAEQEIIKGAKSIDKRQGYKGPLGKIEVKNLDERNAKERIKFYRDNSLFFTVDSDYKRAYELEFDESEMDVIREVSLKFKEDVRDKRFHSGNLDTDKVLSLLRENENFEAVVEKVDDWARVIYVNLMGLRGIIPYDGYNWAHERNITEERTYYTLLQRPSRVFKPGDIVLVDIKKLNGGLYNNVSKAFQKYINKKNAKTKTLIKKQKYLILDLDQEPEAQAAIVSLSPATGRIVSLVGGTDFNKSQFNRALQSKRQPGSSFKPILFAAALEHDYTPATIIIDSPEALGGVDDALNWKPRNYDGKFKGPITFRNALEQSRNVPTIKIAHSIGVKGIFSFADRIGFKAKLDPDLSVSLGSFGVTLMDIVSTYGIFPNGGKKLMVRAIESVTDRDGNKVEFGESELTNENNENELLDEIKEPIAAEDLKIEIPKNPFLMNLDEEQVYDKKLAYIMSNLMKGIVRHGTGRSARKISPYIGGKTGTTNNYVDAWFIGFSNNLVTGVWTGFDDNKTLGWGETGAKSALPIWKAFMKAGITKYGESDFKIPEGIVNVFINKQTGKVQQSGQKDSFLEAFVENTEPGQEDDFIEKVENLKVEEMGQVLEEDDYYSQQ